MITCIVSDLDGTLVDSRADILASQRHALAAIGAPPPDPALLEALFGHALPEVFGQCLPPGQRDEGTIDRCRHLYRTHYIDHCTDRTRPYPGVVAALKNLRTGRAGPGNHGHRYRIAVATSKRTSTARWVLRRLRLTHLFDAIQGTDDFPAKPAPDVILRALQRLKARPAEAVVVGDTDLDVQAGKAAGAVTCLVTHGGWSETAIAESEPTFIVREFTELPLVLASAE